MLSISWSFWSESDVITLIKQLVQVFVQFVDIKLAIGKWLDLLVQSIDSAWYKPCDGKHGIKLLCKLSDLLSLAVSELWRDQVLEHAAQRLFERIHAPEIYQFVWTLFCCCLIGLITILDDLIDREYVWPSANIWLGQLPDLVQGRCEVYQA